MPKPGKKLQQETFGYATKYRIPETGAEFTFVQGKDVLITSVISDGVGWEKSVGEAQVGEFFAGLLNFIDAPLSELESVLDGTPGYYKAKTEVCIINSDNVAIPKTRFYLLKGLLGIDEIKSQVDLSDLDEKIMMEGSDFSPFEYDLMTNYLHALLKRECDRTGLECVTPATVRYQYLKGDGLYPKEWGFFNIFCAVNPEFREFTKGWTKEESVEDGQKVIKIRIEQGSNAFWYDTYVNKRRRLRGWLQQFKQECGTATDEERHSKIRRVFEREYSGSHDVTPELQVLFQRWDGKDSQQVNVQLVEKTALTRVKFEIEKRRELNKRRRVRIIENRSPSYPKYRRYQEMPLCCVNTLLTNMFRYSLLKYLSTEFNRRQLPHCWIREVADLVLYRDGIETQLTKEVMKRIKRCEPYVDKSYLDLGNGVPIEKKFYELDAVAESVRHYISVGEVGKRLGLSAGEFISFYNTLKRITLTLPRDYWELNKIGYLMMSRPIAVSSCAPTVSLKDGKIPSEIEIDEIVEKQQPYFKQDRKRLSAQYKEGQQNLQRAMKRVYGGARHIPHVLPWDFLFEPLYLGIPASETERIDILRSFDTAGILSNINSDASIWDNMEVKRYTEAQVSEIFSNLRLPASLWRLIPTENFAEPKTAVPPKVYIPVRPVYSTTLASLAGANAYG